MAQWDPVEEFARLGRRQLWVKTIGSNFAAALKARRTAAGISQQHVAMTMAMLYGHTNWHQTTVAKVEAGEREVRLAEAVALAQIVGSPLSQLIGDWEEVDPDGQHPEEA